MVLVFAMCHCKKITQYSIISRTFKYQYEKLNYFIFFYLYFLPFFILFFFLMSGLLRFSIRRFSVSSSVFGNALVFKEYGSPSRVLKYFFISSFFLFFLLINHESFFFFLFLFVVYLD